MKTIIYIANSESHEIQVLEMNNKYLFKTIQIIPLKGPVQPLVISKKKKFTLCRN
ncbi:hypothetical protein HIC20_01840 [Buchnera aphidicola (Hormaphis cornu)]|nr:hypothetical protein HIC20_01840 [Buchnera aphidicola (Hormaphis cornu)]